MAKQLQHASMRSIILHMACTLVLHNTCSGTLSSWTCKDLSLQGLHSYMGQREPPAQSRLH